MGKNKDFIPAAMLEQAEWEASFFSGVNYYKSGWNWDTDTSTEWTNLTTKRQRYLNAWTKIRTGSFLHSDEVEFLEARKDYFSGNRFNPADTSVRIFITRHIRNNPLVTNEQKRAIGITVPATTIVPTTPENARIEVECIGRVKFMKYLQHYLAISEPGATSIAKGKGIAEISVFIAFTEASVKVSPALNAYQYDGPVKRGAYKRDFTPEQEGLRAWYIVRKKLAGKNAAYGPPSEPFSAIIP
jgi:hypothetical protein